MLQTLMEPKQREQLMLFLESLQTETEHILLDKNLDVFILLNELCGANGLVLYEMGYICEGVKKMLSGEDSPSNFLSFIQQDPNIEEDNRPKLPALAYEIQQKIFDPVLPILKQAGFPIKEGRVQVPPTTDNRQPTTGGGKVPQPTTNYQLPTTQAAPSSELNAKRYPLNASPLDERNIRALTRIAAGTKYSEEELRETFEELPPGLRQSLSSVDTANTIEAVAKKHLLHVDQMASLASETGLVLLGLTHPADFIGNLAKRLRLPENQAREIARDISAEIFVKVRDALRGLHESPTTNNQQPTTQKTPATLIGSSSELNAKRYPLNASPVPASSTPYSPQARWKTETNQPPATNYRQPTTNYPPPTTDNRPPKEDNILVRQARMKEALDREETLRSIENPRSTYEYTDGTNILLRQAQDGERNRTRMDTNETKAATAPERGVAGPTGWRNVAQNNEVRSMDYELRGSPSQPRQSATPLAQPQRLTPTPPAQPKSRPQSESASPQQKPKPDADDFLEQKLQAPMTVLKEERRYTMDPYREPLE